MKDGQEGELLSLPLGQEGEGPGGNHVRKSQENGPAGEEQAPGEETFQAVQVVKICGLRPDCRKSASTTWGIPSPPCALKAGSTLKPAGPPRPLLHQGHHGYLLASLSNRLRPGLPRLGGGGLGGAKVIRMPQREEKGVADNLRKLKMRLEFREYFRRNASRRMKK